MADAAVRPAGHYPDTGIIPVNGSREALFSFAQAVIDHLSGRSNGWFVRILSIKSTKAHALLAGATPRFLNTRPENDFELDYAQLSGEIWSRFNWCMSVRLATPLGG